MIRCPGHTSTPFYSAEGFGSHFSQWVSALYQNIKAYVSYSRFRSEPFPIERGTHQGCPLSPLLFTLTIEPLALLIHSNPKMQGLELGGHQHKLCLFADDVLIFLTSPLISSPNLLAILSHFGQLSSLHINSQKSTALNISLPPTLQSHLSTILPFPWAISHITYLGVKFTANPSDLFSANYPPMLSHLSSVMSKWSSLPLAWLVRITVLKMSILHKIIYLFRVLPIQVPSYFLHILQ